jgi:hypothetical protein
VQIFKAARIAGRYDEAIARCEHIFSDVAAQSARAAGYQPDIRHENPPLCFLDTLQPLRYSKMRASFFLGCGASEGFKSQLNAGALHVRRDPGAITT